METEGREDEFNTHRPTRREFLVRSGLALGAGIVAACTGGSIATPTSQPVTSGATSSAAPRSKKIGFSLLSYRNPRFKNIDQSQFETAVKAAGFEVFTQQADDDPARQATQVENLLSLGLGALAIFPVTGTAAVDMVRKAGDAGVPVIAYNNGIPSKDIKAFVSRNNFEVGEAVAKAAQLDQGLTGNWSIVGGPEGVDIVTDFVKGVMSVLQPQIDAGKARLIDTQYHLRFDPEKARAQAENNLTRYGDGVAGFLCNADVLAQGVLTAVGAAGRTGQVWVGGQDASAAGCRAIILGQMAMSRFTRYDVMARTAADICVKMANGQQISSPTTHETGQGKVPFFPIEQFSVTKKNIVSYLQEYSPSYVDAKAIFEGIPRNQWPEGAEKLPGVGQ